MYMTEEQARREKFEGFMGHAPKHVPHWDPWSNPDAETFITGIDYYAHPRECRLKMNTLYPRLMLNVPETDNPIPKPRLGPDGASSDSEKHTVRWGDGETGSFEQGEKNFKSLEQVLAFSPLEEAEKKGDSPIITRDFSSEQAIYERYRADYPVEPDEAVPGDISQCGFYNTMFMWPLLTFGWELFLESCLLPEFERIMDEFSEINRRLFSAFARLPVNFCVCHDDIAITRGPVCSPQWMRQYIWPRYEEFWSILKAGGKTVIFMSDGNVDELADNVIACGARGIISEPYTDYKRIARNHAGKNLFLCGEGDNRILFNNTPDEIDAMVRSMVETSKMSGGYFMGIGNHIPWNIPGEAVKRYLDRSQEWAIRT